MSDLGFDSKLSDTWATYQVAISLKVTCGTLCPQPCLSTEYSEPLPNQSSLTGQGHWQHHPTIPSPAPCTALGKGHSQQGLAGQECRASTYQCRHFSAQEGCRNWAESRAYGQIQSSPATEWELASHLQCKHPTRLLSSCLKSLLEKAQILLLRSLFFLYHSLNPSGNLLNLTGLLLLNWWNLVWY